MFVTHLTEDENMPKSIDDKISIMSATQASRITFAVIFPITPPSAPDDTAHSIEIAMTCANAGNNFVTPLNSTENSSLI